MNAREHLSIIKTNLEILRDLGIIIPDGDFICPICLKSFSETEYCDLTEEDVPQASLGGTRVTLTCRNCNSTCGSHIDVHLLEALKAHEQRLFLPLTDRKVAVLGDGKKLNAQLKIGENLDFILKIDTKRNNPKIWNDFFDSILHPDSIIDVRDAPMRHKKERIDAAIIKNAYLLLFVKTGFTVLSHEFYNIFREQIMDPDKTYLPIRLWTMQMVDCPDGVFLYDNEGFKGFFVVFTLTLQQRYKFFVFIPVPNTDYEEVKIALESIGPGKRVLLQQFNANKNYITDSATIKELRNWCGIS